MSKPFNSRAFIQIEKIFDTANAQADKAKRLLQRLEDAYRVEARTRLEVLELRDENYEAFHEARLQCDRLEELLAALRSELDIGANEYLADAIFQREIEKAETLPGLFEDAVEERLKALEGLKDGARKGWASKISEFIASGSNSGQAESQSNSTAEGRYKYAIDAQTLACRQNPIRIPTIQNLDELKRPLPACSDFN